MQTVKAGQPLMDVVELCYGADRPLLLVGNHGVGKSELLEQVACELKMRYICRDLSLMEPPDLIGLPHAQAGCTVYSPPKFLPKNGRGLLVFEEMNRCEKYMQSPCLQLLTTRTLNDYRLPNGWLPLAAINPPDEDYQVNALDPALMSRFVQIRVVPDRDEWIRWARDNDIHPAVISYIESESTVFNHPDSSPRSWKYVSDLLHAVGRSKAAPQTLRATVSGLVGDNRAAAFLKSLKKHVQPLTAEEIITAYGKHCKNVQLWVKAGQLDLVTASLHLLMTYLQPRADYTTARNNRRQWTNIGNFIHDLPGDLQATAKTFFRDRKYAFPRHQRRKKRTAK